MRIIKPEQFDYVKFRQIPMQKRKVGNQAGNKDHYKDIITAFDIETTRIKEIEQSVMYVWQWAFGDDVCVVGRTWDEFLQMAENIAYLLKPHQKLVVFVHNLSYEYAFLSGIYNFRPQDVFCLKPRKILKCTMFDRIEFRCSYLHSQMNLKEYTEKMGVEHSKLSGEEFDYSKQRFSWTPLSQKELDYCTYDVIGLVEAIKVDMEHENDLLSTFPLTSTGYVRRDAKREMEKFTYSYIQEQLPNVHIYTMCREAFRGGNTHGNRYFAGHIVNEVHSLDRSSSYPDVLVNRPFPNGHFKELGYIEEDVFNRLLNSNKAILMRVKITGLRLRNKWWGCPYLSRDKCRDIVGAGYDNGRILLADSLETTLTDIDYRIIEYEYIWDSIEFLDVAYTIYRRLPEPFTKLINEYYRRKTILKGNPEAELDYYRAKAKLNSLYGMTAQDPCKPTILYMDGEYVIEDGDVEHLLAKDNKKRKLPCYQVGVWCTAWARWELETGLRLVEESPDAEFIYTDTDSIKYTGTVDFSGYNEEKIKNSTEHGAYAIDSKGKYHYMGVFEEEGTCRRFITLGAKKYAYEDADGELHITISGVIKSKGAKELAKYGGLESFKPDFIFREAGGVEAVYNDKPPMSHYEIDGHTIPITANVVLRESTYTLGITEEYEYLLHISQLEEYRDIF